MDDVFISQISTKRTRSGEAHYVRVPSEWADAQLHAGRRHVQISPMRHGVTELALTPLSKQHVEDYRLEKRREAAREYARRRYRGE